MKTQMIAVLLTVLFLVSGCTTGYKAAVDERRLGTQIVDEKIESTILAKFLGDENIKPWTSPPNPSAGMFT